jgi:hypothetical protein
MGKLFDHLILIGFTGIGIIAVVTAVDLLIQVNDMNLAKVFN